MKIADGLEMLEIESNFSGRQSLFRPALLWDSAVSVLVDTGFPGQLPKISAALDQVGLPLKKLNKIIITHQDIDHIGCLAEIVGGADHKIEVLAHESEKPYIQYHGGLYSNEPNGSLAKLTAANK